MRAIVVKPKSCCGNQRSIGSVIEVTSADSNFLGQDGVGFVCCRDCLKGWIDTASNYFANLTTGGLIEKARVKILPDDLGDELITETSEEQTA